MGDRQHLSDEQLSFDQKNDAKPPKKSDHRHGHRARLRERLINKGGDSLADYELLELILIMAIPRRDVRPLAKELIAEFGSFAAVMHADPAKLGAFTGVGDTAVAAIKSVTASVIRLTEVQVMNQPVLSSWDALISYLRARMAHEKHEQVRVLYLDRKNVLVADEEQSKGTVDQAPLYPREVIKRALDLAASAIILVHNHPSGNPKPSKGDIIMTRDLIKACTQLDIKVHDHVIIGKHGQSSFKTMGLI